MKCSEPKIGKLISIYEFGQLTEDKKNAFENHLLECDYCFQSLFEMSPVVEEIQKNPEIYLTILKETKRQSITEKALKIWENIKFSVQKFIEFTPKSIRYAAPVVIGIIVLAVFILPTTEKKYADLARIEPIRYIPITTRTGENLNEFDRLFDEGMQFYSGKKYNEAIVKFRFIEKQKPENIELLFYLGICELMEENINHAIEDFKKALELDGTSYSESLHWYLGNAYLKKEDVKRAINEFRKVIELAGDYKWKAKGIMREIEELNNK